MTIDKIYLDTEVVVVVATVKAAVEDTDEIKDSIKEEEVAVDQIIKEEIDMKEVVLHQE